MAKWTKCRLCEYELDNKELARFGICVMCFDRIMDNDVDDIEDAILEAISEKKYGKIEEEE